MKRRLMNYDAFCSNKKFHFPEIYKRKRKLLKILWLQTFKNSKFSNSSAHKIKQISFCPMKDMRACAHLK
jgi:hypothetical protein